MIFHDAYISLPGSARVVVDGRELAAITHSMFLPSPPDGLTAPLVDARGGDLSGLGDLSGCILLVGGIASPALAQAASRAGAAGQLGVHQDVWGVHTAAA